MTVNELVDRLEQVRRFTEDSNDDNVRQAFDDVNQLISELENDLPILYSTPELNINVTDDVKFKIIEDFSKQCSLNGEKITIDGLRINFDNGWGLLRASNTTPKLVLRFEGDSIDDLNQIKKDFLNELSRICPDIDINLV